MKKVRRSLELQSGTSVNGRRRARKDRPASADSLPRTSRRRQRDVLCDVMFSASRSDSWLTLDELAKLTHYPPASISAQLRHLRKPEFGGYEVEKQQRVSGRLLRGEDFGTVWEYRLRRRVREIRRRRDAVQRRAQRVVSAAV